MSGSILESHSARIMNTTLYGHPCLFIIGVRMMQVGAHSIICTPDGSKPNPLAKFRMLTPRVAFSVRTLNMDHQHSRSRTLSIRKRARESLNLTTPRRHTLY